MLHITALELICMSDEELDQFIYGDNPNDDPSYHSEEEIVAVL